MAHTTHGIGGLTYDPTKKARPPELNVFVALILIVVAFEAIGRLFLHDSFLFNTRDNVDAIFNWPRLNIIILQVSIVGIIAVGVTQVIITGGIDLSSGSVVGATAMITMSFAQTAVVNGNPNPKAIFGDWAMDLPVIVPVMVGLGCGIAAGLVNGLLIAYTRIPPFIATLGMMVFARGLSRWWSNGNPISFPTEGYAAIGKGMMPVLEATIAAGASTITDPAFRTPAGKVRPFSLVLANFPFSDEFWWLKPEQHMDDKKKKDKLKKEVFGKEGYKDPFGRFGRGTAFRAPPAGYGDYAFIASLADHGRAGIVCPQGVLFRGQPEVEEETGEFDYNGNPII